MFPSNFNLKNVFITSLVFTVVVTIAMQITGGWLVSKEAPLGILSFEFAGDLQTAQTMVNSWSEQDKIYAGLNLGLDYLFLLAYSILLASASILITNRFKEKSEFVKITGYTIATGCLVAGGLDAIENYALINILVGKGSDAFAWIALWCAIPKFVLVIFAIIYIAVGGLYLLISRE